MSLLDDAELYHLLPYITMSVMPYIHNYVRTLAVLSSGVRVSSLSFMELLQNLLHFSPYNRFSNTGSGTHCLCVEIKTLNNVQLDCF